MNYEEYRFKTLPSTQDFLREKQGDGRDMLAVAERQTQGKGTKNRSFECSDGGLWISLLKFHQGAPAKDTFLMMAHAAVAVCKTLEFYGLQPRIKWANDVLINGKKVCGILTENRLRGDEIVSTLWGVGLNVNNPLSDALSPIATTMKTELKTAVDLAELEARLLAYFYGEFDFAQYAERLAYVGEEVEFTAQGAPFSAVLKGVTERGELLLEKDGVEKRCAYGEITLGYKGRL